ncbi:hypothetical protein A4X09_0g5719 [Tilletia walkeri]|uniref:Fungal lipase-type domain-containing protein n=1 Tax=Tilletia walkeri TaxID=117179 RepID=A0A8X7N579_9BASI|nr:hypothetical protein A4X09_0g5719 [Tilletia walkeri]
MPDDEHKKSATSKITSGLGKFARDAAISSVLEKGIREVSRNKSLRRAGKDLIVNYARSKSADKGGRRYESESEDSEEEERRRASKGKGKGKSREMNSMGRGREYYESDQGGRSRSVNQGYYDAPRREPPPSRSRKSSFGDSWLEKAFGSAPSWNRGSGFTTSDDPRRAGGAGLSRSMSNPGGQPQSQQQVQGYSYSHGGHGYAFRDPPSQARASIDGLPAQDQHYSPYDPNYRHHQSARREDEERDRAFRARQQELGGVAMSSTGVPLYGYRPGEEPVEEQQQQQQQRPQSEHRGLPRFFSAMAHSPVTTPGGGSGGNRTPIETRVGTFNSTGSGLYSKVFSRSPPVPAGSPNAVEGVGYVGGMKELPGLPQTRHSLPPELKSKTQRYVEPVPPTSEQQYQQQMQHQQHQQMLQQQQPQQRSASHSPERTIDRRTNTPAVVQQSSTRGFPTPQITAETTIQTLSFASRCSQIVYHLSTPPSVRHYQKNYDSHLSNPSLLETHFADPNRGTKNWALLRRKVDGALIVAVRGSGRGLSRGTDYSADMSWLDDEEWLSDMMLNLKAKKWSGGTSSGGSISRRNSTGGNGDKRKTLSLSSIRCADGSTFEAHEGFLKCAMAMYADVGRAVDKKLKMWTVLAASSGVQMGIGGKGSPAWEERLPQQQQGGGGGGGGGEFISPPEIIFTGHSAGGAVASLLYVLFDAGNRELLDRFGKVSVITFGTAAAFPHPRSAPLTHANTHSSRRSNAGRVRDVHISIIHKDDPIPRMDVQYALSLLETALGGPRNASAALMGLQAVAGQSKNREVGELVKLVREGAERAKELRKREKEVKRMKDAAEEVVGGGVPGQVASGSGEMPPKTNAGMMLWPAGDLFLLAPASSSSSGGKDKKRDDGSMPKSILKSGSGSSKKSSIPKVQTPPTPTPTNNAVQMQLYTYTHSHLARSKPAEWSSHRIAKYFSILDEMEKRIPGLRV